MKKFIIFLFSLLLFGFGFGTDYLYFYTEGCEHCAKVDEYLTKNNLYQKYNIQKKEVRFNQDNLKLLQEHYQKQGIDASSPKYGRFPLVVADYGSSCVSYLGETDIINYFQNIEESGGDAQICLTGGQSVSQQEKTVYGFNFDKEFWSKFAYFGVILPAALADSINPCAFTVMLLLLGAILTKHKNVKKVFLAGGLFTLSIFISYFLMGIGLYKALASTANTFYLKLAVGALGLIVGLANIKDFFWYGKGFVMEVPFSWRPLMKKIIESIVSPWGAFIIGIIVSLFLLPCTSGPYFTILGYLASQSKEITTWGYAYLFVYNFLFVLPMIGITFLIGLGVKNVEELAKFKNKNTKLIHLIVGLIMLGLAAYVFWTL